MSKLDNIFLIGPMGAGKTSVARQLSRLTGYPFFDSDQAIQDKSGVSISWIFEVEGEARFREREAIMIDELTRGKHVIVSTGGGAIVTPSTCTLLDNRGFVVYLTVSLDLQYERTKRQRGHRPLIDVADAREALIRLNTAREPLYKSIADRIYSTDDQTPRAIAQQIYQDYKAQKE